MAASTLLLVFWEDPRLEDPLAQAELIDPPPPVVSLSPDSAPGESTVASEAAQIRMIKGDGQQGRAGRTLPQVLEIRVEDALGNPVPAVPVMWEATVGGGVLSPQFVETDLDGIARSIWTLGPEVITQYAQARVLGYESGLAFEAFTDPGLAARLTVIAGNHLSAPPGAILSDSVTVRVEGAEGEPLEGVTVAFLPQGEGSVSDSAAASSPTGLVRTEWKVGTIGDSARLDVHVRDTPGIRTTLVAAIDHAMSPTVPGVVAGGTHTCELLRAGVLRCWGGNDRGQLGTTLGSRTPTPTPVTPGTRYSVVAAGMFHTCAVGQRGTASCWGDNADGQLGIDSRTSAKQPVRVVTDQRFRTISAGTGHTCGVTRTAAVLCWGSNVTGQLGDGTRDNRLTPVPVAAAGPFQAVSVGWFHTCALDPAGRSLCWGRNAFGQLGDGSTEDSAHPTSGTGDRQFAQVSAGGAHTCGLGVDRLIYCWGQNRYGQLGDGTTEARLTPGTTAGSGGWRAVAVGGVHSCGLATDGSAFCWGRNSNGQLGDGSTEDRYVPTAVAGRHRFTSIYASGAHTCATTPSGQSYCWGYNVEGQLGDGTRENRLTPTLVRGG